MNNRVYWTIMLVLVVAILATGVMTARQTYQRHELYFALAKERQVMNAMKVEEQRLLIEQQTFSATPHVAQRSVAQLGMFFPTDSDKLVITP